MTSLKNISSMNHHQRVLCKSTTKKTRFTRLFTQALRCIKSTTPQSSSRRNIILRSRMIKYAANMSMASAVGVRRSWTRALLFRIRKRVMCRGKQKVGTTSRRKRGMVKCRKRGELGREDELRQLVPGGKKMDLFSLLDETAHYIKCLNTQVQVMQSIVDLY